MPPTKNRKQSDKDVIWSWCYETEVDYIDSKHLEYVYRLTQIIPRNTKSVQSDSSSSSGIVEHNRVDDEMDDVNSVSSAREDSNKSEQVDHRRCR